MAEYSHVIAAKLLALADLRERTAESYETKAMEHKMRADALHSLAMVVKDGGLTGAQMEAVLDITAPPPFFSAFSSQESEIDRIKTLLKQLAPTELVRE